MDIEISMNGAILKKNVVSCPWPDWAEDIFQMFSLFPMIFSRKPFQDKSSEKKICDRLTACHFGKEPDRTRGCVE